MTGKKYEPPLRLDMDFGEALERFGKTDKNEVDKLLMRSKRKKAEKEQNLPSKLVNRKNDSA